MAAVSFSVVRGTGEYSLTAGAEVVTEGTSAPGAGDLEVRIADPASVAWTKQELYLALEKIWRYLDDVRESTSIPL